MKASDLLQKWEKTGGGQLTDEHFEIRLPLEDAAKIAALAEMFPRLPVENLLTDLISAALRDLESSFPYIKGSRVVGNDEQGDPLYEDVGPTPRYLDLTKKHMHRYRQSNPNTH